MYLRSFSNLTSASRTIPTVILMLLKQLDIWLALQPINWLKDCYILIREVKLLCETLLSGWVALILWLPIMSFTGYGYVLDFNTRLGSNDAYVGTYYFWWTNLTYLPAFFFVLLSVALLSCVTSRLAWILVATPICFIFYSTELVDYLAVNVSYSSSIYGLCGSNTLLTNTLNRYHPFIFYTSSLLVTISLVQLALSLTPPGKLFTRSKLSTLVIPMGWYSCFVNLLALWMGSWWALQEGTWGGWWNWDPSETFGLLITVAAVSVLHTTLTQNSAVGAWLKLFVIWLLVLFSYFFIQLNFDLVSHNFGSKFFFFFNNNLFFIEFVLVLVFALISTVSAINGVNRGKRLFFGDTPSLTLSPNPVLRCVPSFVVLVWVIWSYRPLFNYFIWNFCEVNVLNFEISLQPVNFVAVILLLSLLSRLNVQQWALSLAVLSMSTNWLWAFITLLSLRSQFHLLHSALLFLTLLNLTLFDVSIVSWLTDPSMNYAAIGTSIKLVSSTVWSPDSTTWESAKVWSASDASSSINWNLYALSNSQAINFFSLNSSHSYFQNFYDLGGLYSNPSIYLELPLVGSLNLLFSLVLHSLLIQVVQNVSTKNF